MEGMALASSRGQEFEGFKLLIAVTMAVLIFSIILGIVNNLNNERFDISIQNLLSAVQNAAASPNGDVVRVQSLSFRKGTSFNQLAFSNLIGTDESCIELQSSSSRAFSVQDNVIEFKSEMTTDVFIQCQTNTASASNCPIYCTVSFGKELSNAS